MYTYVVVGKGVNRMKGEALNDGGKGGGCHPLLPLTMLNTLNCKHVTNVY
jgi:hypothetical protein